MSTFIRLVLLALAAVGFYALWKNFTAQTKTDVETDVKYEAGDVASAVEKEAKKL